MFVSKKTDAWAGHLQVWFDFFIVIVVGLSNLTGKKWYAQVCLNEANFCCAEIFCFNVVDRL